MDNNESQAFVQDIIQDPVYYYKGLVEDGINLGMDENQFAQLFQQDEQGLAKVFKYLSSNDQIVASLQKSYQKKKTQGTSMFKEGGKFDFLKKLQHGGSNFNIQSKDTNKKAKKSARRNAKRVPDSDRAYDRRVGAAVSDFGSPTTLRSGNQYVYENASVGKPGFGTTADTYVTITPELDTLIEQTFPTHSGYVTRNYQRGDQEYDKIINDLRSTGVFDALKKYTEPINELQYGGAIEDDQNVLTPRDSSEINYHLSEKPGIFWGTPTEAVTFYPGSTDQYTVISRKLGNPNNVTIGYANQKPRLHTYSTEGPKNIPGSFWTTGKFPYERNIEELTPEMQQQIEGLFERGKRNVKSKQEGGVIDDNDEGPGLGTFYAGWDSTGMWKSVPKAKRYFMRHNYSNGSSRFEEPVIEDIIGGDNMIRSRLIKLNTNDTTYFPSKASFIQALRSNETFGNKKENWITLDKERMKLRKNGGSLAEENKINKKYIKDSEKAGAKASKEMSDLKAKHKKDIAKLKKK